MFTTLCEVVFLESRSGRAHEKYVVIIKAWPMTVTSVENTRSDSEEHFHSGPR